MLSRSVLRTCLTRTFWLPPIVALGACDRAPQTSANDTTTAPPVTEGALANAPATSFNGWDVDEAGLVLAVAAGTVETAVVVLPQYTDSTLAATTRFDTGMVPELSMELFSPAGRLGTASLNLVPATPRAGCTGWPIARVIANNTGIPFWTVAFEAGHAEPVALDSIEALSSRDSARVAADVARLASTLPENSASPFRGLPFIVRSVRHFTPVPGVEAFVADIVRRLGLEANPRVEHLVLVAERPAGTPATRYEVAYSERVDGAEETIEMTELLAAVRLGDDLHPTLVLSRDYGDGTAYALLERVGAERWRLQWSSAYAGC